MSFHTSHRLLLVFSAVGYLTLTVIIAVVPAATVQNTPPLAGAASRSDLEERGREIYLAEGCGFCHTQFLRDLPMDKPYGRQSVAEDYAQESPPLLGTQRTGPDLANVGRRQPSDTWHLLHLFNPRAVVPDELFGAIGSGEVLLAEGSLHAALASVAGERGCELLTLEVGHGALCELLFHEALRPRPSSSGELEPLYLMGTYADG